MTTEEIYKSTWQGMLKNKSTIIRNLNTAQTPQSRSELTERLQKACMMMDVWKEDAKSRGFEVD